ncbi:MAG: ParA family protein [Desulfurococcales archaeon]|nr:ParA family protein [Desulfurococcales archaeon]
MVFIVGFYSLAGGVQRTSLVLATAWLLSRRYNLRVGLADFDFEASTLFLYTGEPLSLLEDYLGRRRDDAFTLMMWPRKDRLVKSIVDVEINDLTLKLLPTYPLVEVVDKVTYNWASSFRVRQQYLYWFRKLIEMMAGEFNLDLVIIDTRSGLTLVTQDLLLAVDSVFVVSRSDLMGLRRTILGLAELYRGLPDEVIELETARGYGERSARDFFSDKPWYLAITHIPVNGGGNVQKELEERLRGIRRKLLESIEYKGLPFPPATLLIPLALVPYVEGLDKLSSMTIKDFLVELDRKLGNGDGLSVVEREYIKAIGLIAERLNEDYRRTRHSS